MANYKTSWVQRLIEGAWQKTFAFAHAKTVYTDYANKKTLEDKLSEIDTEIVNKANKTEIPTELPANGGNSATVNGHTVKSDVPENAVFTDTVYDDTEVKERISRQSTEMMDIKMLGWSVPKECPVQNEVNGNQFIQKVGRVDLGSLDWMGNLSGEHFRFLSTNLKGIVKGTESSKVSGNIYTQTLKNVSADSTYLHQFDKSISINQYGDLYVYDSAYSDATAFKTAMQGKYLYYELATPITTTIDGNEIGETVSDVRKETTVNLLNPTLQTTTNNGVTCTNNGDGTYTVSTDKNGATANSEFFLTNFLDNIYQGKNFIGCPSGGSDSTYTLNLGFYDSNKTWIDFSGDIGNGSIIKELSKCPYIRIYISIKSGTICDNLIFKPMITANLNATYDDFVPYTGNTGSLNWDVASLLKRIETLESLVNKTDTTVTE